ncbi:hypothetical protein EJB05_26895, partial [Eragrostis curvula]
MALQAAPKRVAGEPDWLSALPDCLLHTIMSFMKARQVVQMCVLSTRWKHLWLSAPCLDVDLDEFKTVEQGYDSDDEDDIYDVDDKNWQVFEDFIFNLMLRRNIALLDSFRLCVSGRAPDNGNKNAGAWVRRAIKYCASYPGIQREGLSSNSWRLKRLHLFYVFLDSVFAEHVSSACHSLEDLELKYCPCEFPAITSHSLKNLSLVIDGGSNRCLLVITAPAVAYLCMQTYRFDAGIATNEMPSLDKALISLPGYRVFKVLCGVSNMTRLELSYFEKMVLSEEYPAFKEFSNLRNLLLDNCDLGDDLQTLALFLENSPRLEKLTLRYCEFSNDSKKKKGTPKPKKRSSCLDVQCVNLKLTEIIYEEDDDVRQLVEFLLPISGKLQKNHLKLTKVD